MNGDELKRRLWDLGHFRNPEMPTTVIENELDDLTLTSPGVRLAIRSYQDFMREDFDRLSQSEHGRNGIADGDIGPATSQLFAVERCGCSDYPDDVQPAIGSGSWPSGCWKEYPNNHAYSIYIDRSSMPSYLTDITDAALDLAFAAYRNMGLACFESPDPIRCNSRVKWKRGSGWIGLAIVGQGLRCSTKPIWAYFDNRYQPRQMLYQWARLFSHEFGHNHGLRHSRGGIMAPSISSGVFTETAWRGDPSERILTRWFGGEPVPPRNPPQPPTDPDVPTPPTDPKDRLVIRGTHEMFLGGQSLGKYHITPVPRV